MLTSTCGCTVHSFLDILEDNAKFWNDVSFLLISKEETELSLLN